jgi:hypothetical protein
MRALGLLAPHLAHQGGWDEILLVAGPIVVIVAVLAVVKRPGVRRRIELSGCQALRSIPAPTARNRPTRSS